MEQEPQIAAPSAGGNRCQFLHGEGFDEHLSRYALRLEWDQPLRTEEVQLLVRVVEQGVKAFLVRLFI